MCPAGTRRAENPPEILTHPSNGEYETGHTRLEMMCQVRGYPEPRVQFYHDGRLVDQNSLKYQLEYRDHGEWALVVWRLDPGDAGEWSVTAENSLGSSTRDWNIMILSRPDTSDTSDLIRAPESFQDDEDEDVLSDHASDNEVIVVANIETVTDQDEDDENIDANDDNDAPRPGTLADREHRKWVEQAVSITNNPYTRENIEKRNQRNKIFDASTKQETDKNPILQTTDDAITNHNNVAHDENKKIYCGLRSVSSSRYNRDYIVNQDDSGRVASRDISFSPELRDTVLVHTDKDEDSTGDSKHWDSGVGSSCERTSTISVSEGIKKFSDTSGVYRAVSVDSLLQHDVDPPVVPAKTSGKYQHTTPPTPPPPSKRSVLKQKKVSYQEKKIQSGRNSDFEFYDNDDHYEWVEEFQESSPIPRLPSVKDLAALFQQTNISPEPKPRKSLAKVCHSQ